MVIFSNCDFDIYLIVELLMKIGGVLIGGFFLEISMVLFLFGWGVNLLIKYYLFNLWSVEFNRIIFCFVVLFM